MASVEAAAAKGERASLVWRRRRNSSRLAGPTAAAVENVKGVWEKWGHSSSGAKSRQNLVGADKGLLGARRNRIRELFMVCFRSLNSLLP